MASRPPLDEPEFARWRSEADRALEGGTTAGEAIAVAEIVLAYVDETGESIGA